MKKFKLHNPNSPILIGEISEDDEIKEMNQKSFIDYEKTIQTRLL